MIQKNTIKQGLYKGWKTFLILIKIIIPVQILVTILKYTSLIEIISRKAAPLMMYLGLSGEAIMALITGYLLNIYAAIGVMTSLELSPRQITILGTMLGISHSLIIETAVIKRIKVKTWLLNILRVSLSLIAGYFLNIVL